MRWQPQIGDRVQTPHGTGIIIDILDAHTDWTSGKPTHRGPYARIRYPNDRRGVWAFDKLKEVQP